MVRKCQEASMKEAVQSDKRHHATKASVGVFLRYGYARTTMGDLAKAAGMSRPAFYLIFPSKEEAFSAVVHHMNSEVLSEIRNELVRYDSVEQKLLFACERWGAGGYDLLERYPDARDMFDLAFKPVREIYEKFQALLAEVLATSNLRLDATPQELARILAFAIRGFKEAASSSTEMRRLIAVVVASVASTLKGGSTGKKRPTSTS